MKKSLSLLALPLVFSALSASAQKSVTTGATKHVLVEESTGAWCQYCPDGAVYLNNILTANPTNVVGVSIHGGGTDNMRFAEGDAITSAYFTGFPKGMVDRAPGGDGKPEQNRGNWASMVTQQLALSPNFSVTLEHGFNTSTGVIDVKATAKALKAVTGNYNINVYIVEDSVSGTGSGWNQVNAYNTQAGHPYYQKGNPIVGFQHMHVVRAMLGGAYGTTGVIPANAAINTVSSKRYTYTVPAGFKINRFKVVALVQKESTVLKEKVIDNVVESNLTVGALSVSSVPALASVNIYPNPAVNQVGIKANVNGKADVKLSIVNAVGQTVMQKSYANNNGEIVDNLNVEKLSSGVYYMTFTSAEGVSSEKLTIVK